MAEGSINRRTSDWLIGGAEMGDRIRSFNWSQTSLGAISSWPQSLKSLVKTLLTSRYPMVLTWGPEFTQFYNDAYSQLIGDKHPVALGTDIRDTLAEAWDTLGPMIQRVMATGVANWTPALLLVLERAGYREESYFSVSHAPAEDDFGQIVGMLAVCSEVTQQILGERRLRLLRDLASLAGETRNVEVTCQDLIAAIAAHPLDVPFALLYLREPDGKTLILQGAVGLSADELTSPRSVDLATSHDIWSLAQAAAGETVLVEAIDRQITVPGGPWNEPVHSALVMPIASSGQTAPLGVLVAGISPNRALDEGYRSFYELLVGQVSASIRNAQAYEEERRRAEMLAEIDRAKTVFFSNVSHEFRTPLTLMLNPLEDVLESGNLPPVEREQITVAHRNSLRLLKLVNTLLDFSRIEADRIQAVYELTDLATLTADLASVFRSAIEKAGLQLVVNCPPLPEPVYVDRDMWEKIVLNLLSNAFKFTFEGQISVSLHPVKDSVELIIKDTGIGIPAEELPHLFERFHRVAGAQGRSYEGSGIGLSLVQELVKLHGGTVGVSSVLDEGSTFVVRLPIGSTHLPPERIQATRTQTSTASGATSYIEEALGWVAETRENPSSTEGALPHRSSARILVADDNADMRHYLQRLLSEHYDIEVVADGQAALEAARAQVPDLVLTDVMMPKLDGFGLLRELRAAPQTREIPILLLSARAGEEAAVEGLEAGADDYLVKPFSARELLARVATNLELGRARQAASQQRFRFLAESIHQMVWTADSRGWVDYYSPRWFDYTGLTLTQSQGFGWQDVIHPEDRQRSIEVWTQAAERDTIYDIEHRLRQADGSYRWHLTRALPMLDENGQVIRWFGTCTDISDRKRIEAEREQLLQREQTAREAAERANQIKDEFLAVLSHELRSPLNPILGWSRLLQEGKLDEVRTAHALETIERNAKLQVQLIDDLLDVSRILQGKLSLNVAPVNLATTITAALETVRLAAAAKSIQIQTMMEPDVGRILGDSGRLQQVIWNLLSNAVKFTPQGGRVELRLEQFCTDAQITVSDTGKGIHPDFLPHVFEYFRQADSATTRQFGGLGLGLAIVRQIVELHGGTVEAASPGVGQGAIFTVRFPLMPHQSAIPQQVRESKPPSGLQGVKVLVVEDTTDMREYITFVLEQAGATVVAVASAAQALTALDQFQPEVLVSDIGMPEMDGYMLLRQVRRRSRSDWAGVSPQQGGQIPAIALTAYAGEINQQQAIAAGFQRHLAKPIEPEALVKVIADLTRAT